MTSRNPKHPGAADDARLRDDLHVDSALRARRPVACLKEAAWVTRRLGLQAEAPAPQAVLAIESRLPLKGELMSLYVDEALVVTGASLRDLDFPEG
jgi:hypothetical protein